MVKVRAMEGPTDGVVGWHWLGNKGGVLGVLWYGCGGWHAVEAWVSNNVILVGISMREEER
jgi:hypothetical protein